MSNNPVLKPEWSALNQHMAEIRKTHMRQMFESDPGRATAFSRTLDGLFVDYSKNRITARTMELLYAFARACQIESWRDRMFAGDPINTTEKRAVLHTALRRPSSDKVTVDGENIMPFIHDVLKRMEDFTN